MNAPEIKQVGEWIIGWVDGKINDTGWSLWWGHESTDEELGCGNLELDKDGYITDYDTVSYEPPNDVWRAVAEAGYGIRSHIATHHEIQLSTKPIDEIASTEQPSIRKQFIY